MNKEKMWNEFTKINKQADKYDAWDFGGTTDDMPNELAELVRIGKKTATASAYLSYKYENEPLPLINGYNIILNTQNEAICITRTKKVYTTSFCEVTEEHAYKEGEGDRSLSFWRNLHKEFFENELKSIGEAFSVDMLVVCEEFEVVYPLNN